LHERHVIVMEAAAAIGGERIDHAGAMRGLAARTEGEDLREIIRRPLTEEFVEHGKVALLRSGLDPAAHPRIVLAVVRTADEVIHWTAQPFRAGEVTARILLALVGETSARRSRSMEERHTGN
jgi:hypothetical protein